MNMSLKRVAVAGHVVAGHVVAGHGVANQR